MRTPLWEGVVELSQIENTPSVSKHPASCTAVKVQGNSRSASVQRRSQDTPLLHYSTLNTAISSVKRQVTCRQTEKQQDCGNSVHAVGGSL